MRQFNTEGPVIAGLHYLIPPLTRIDVGHLDELVDQMKYFVVHAPRQTGKTTCLMAYADHLNQGGRYHAVYTNVEAAQAQRGDVAAAIPVVAGEIAAWAEDLFGDTIPGKAIAESPGPPESVLSRMLSRWCAQAPKPIVLILDEADALIGDSLLSVLRQLRAGYAKRPKWFPHSVILCGLRDVHDYRVQGSDGSPFNIRAESIRLGDFTVGEVAALYGQHTAETGQEFTADALDRVWNLTLGQPWLVNALAKEAVAMQPSGAITANDIDQAKEALILGRVTHIDQLAQQLAQDRVRRVIAPILEGRDPVFETDDGDIRYCIDLGLIRRGDQGLEIANPIYREVVPRSLSNTVQIALEGMQKTAWYVKWDGRLDLPKLLGAFQQFFREHSESWVERFQYKEAGPQLLLQAFLQRIVNGGGRVEREYGLGRKRTDLLIVWPYGGGTQRAVIELKTAPQPPSQAALTDALAQTADYMDRCGASEGHLLWFDRGPHN
ncbi:MAG: ATP-binding protein, partial [Acidobacteria bacterium]|nr:ATP-binding protein [Acidobacteriota bacterium]